MLNDCPRQEIAVAQINSVELLEHRESELTRTLISQEA